jgi:hypothetical protein
VDERDFNLELRKAGTEGSGGDLTKIFFSRFESAGRAASGVPEFQIKILA